MTLVLFDIDGTLIVTAQAGIRGMAAAFAELHGHPAALDGVPIAGRTDRAIVTDAFAACGVAASDDDVWRLRDRYLELLPGELARPSTLPKRILPGVEPLMAALAEHDDLHVGLLTGNFEQAARLKLGYFDLWDAFGFGAFGDHHVNRRDLVPLAAARARAAGRDLGEAPDVVVIGDTPLDIDCAHAHGAWAIGVATGIYDRAALEAAGADLVVGTLSELDVHDVRQPTRPR